MDENIMARNLTLAARLREVLLNGHWIANTNIKEQVLSVDWKQATLQIYKLNTIAALTYHLNYYLFGLLSALKTGRLEISDKFSFDHPVITSKEDWEKLVSEFVNNGLEFSNFIEQSDETFFDQPFIDEKYGTIQRNIEGVIEHSYYHLGQISLIRKIILQNQ
ncbi:MAG: DUF1572 domain-containing protein [Bacteroidota bacterium]|nr:DUF1572 domain-containing protein [Bacteroidota bacterium]